MTARRRRRVTKGRVRDELTERVKQMYVENKMSVREIAADLDFSYGKIHRLLGEAGVELREKRDAQRARKAREDGS